jgi:hypothetical protein
VEKGRERHAGVVLSVHLIALTAGMLVWVAVAGLASSALAVLGGRLTPAISIASLTLGLVVGGWTVRAIGRGRPTSGSESIGTASGLALLAFAIVSVRQFLGVCFENGPVVQTLLPNNYGDLPLHWTYVAYLARGAPFWPDNPIAAGDRLRYPFGVDLVTALLAQLGPGIPVLFRLMGLAGAALAAHALYLWGRGIALAAFLFSGGWMGLRLEWAAGLLETAPSLAWKNLFLTLFVPQRGFLFALPAGLFLLWSWRQRFLRREPGLPAWVEGLLWGALPLFHLHTFLFVSIVGALWAVLTRRLKEALATLVWAFPFATWCVWQVTDGFQSASLVWWKPGWVMGSQNPLVFLALNFGLWLPLVLVALVRAWRRRDREALFTLGPGLGGFILLFFVMLAPWDWDNTKVMLWCFLIVLPSVFELVVRPLALPLRTAVVVLLLLPGAVAIVQASLPRRPPAVVADRGELEGVCATIKALAPAERVVVTPTFNHPVALCGQAIAAGYSGHLWSHGIAAEDLERNVVRVLAGEPGWTESARALGVRALFWGPREAKAFPSSARPWESSAVRIGSGTWGDLFRLEAVTGSPAR